MFYQCKYALDTVEVMSGYVDVVVMRHPEPGAVKVSVVIFSLIFALTYRHKNNVDLACCKTLP